MKMWFELETKNADPKTVSTATLNIIKMVSENQQYASEMFMNPATGILHFSTSHLLKDQVEATGFQFVNVSEKYKGGFPTLVKMWDEKTVD